MTERLDYFEGRRLGAVDLNRESASREADEARHLDLAHPAGAPVARLVGATVRHPTGSPSVGITPQGPAAGVRMALRDATSALELGVSGVHHAAGSVTGHRSEVRVSGRLRMVSQPQPGVPSVPWSIRAMDILGVDGGLVGRELRIELSAPPGSRPQESRVAVGNADDEEGFRPVLVVDSAGTVTLEGDLEVAGSVSQGEVQPDPEDPLFVELLADVVARRVVGAATASSNPVLKLNATAGDTSVHETTLDISIEPTRALTRWGAALETQRQGTSSFCLIGVGGPVAASVELTIDAAAVPWDPPLSASSPGQLVIAIVAFDAQGALHAQRATTSPLTG